MGCGPSFCPVLPREQAASCLWPAARPAWLSGMVAWNLLRASVPLGSCDPLLVPLLEVPWWAPSPSVSLSLCVCFCFSVSVFSSWTLGVRGVMGPALGPPGDCSCPRLLRAFGKFEQIWAREEARREHSSASVQMFFASAVWNLAGRMRQEFSAIFFFFTAPPPASCVPFSYKNVLFSNASLPLSRWSFVVLGFLWNSPNFALGDFRAITHRTTSESPFVWWGSVGSKGQKTHVRLTSAWVLAHTTEIPGWWTSGTA